MKIGVWIESDYAPTYGGGASYHDKLVKAIDDYHFHPSLELCYVYDGEIKETLLNREIICLNWQYHKTLRDRILLHIPIVKKYYKIKYDARLARLRHSAYREILTKNGVHVIYYLRQLQAYIPSFPFVATNWDIGHCSTFAFPELALGGNFEQRRHFYSEVLPQALFVFAESEAGKQELLRYTNIADYKIKVVPLFAGDSVTLQVSKEEQIKILRMYGLTQNHYFFYPAQFWAHKNHYNLLMAFAQFIKAHPDYKLVLTGSDQGNLEYIKTLIQKLHLKDDVIFPGFVPIDRINTFYQNATALVMASYFGPTNMPPIEAMELGCPVICSDLAGHREILDDAAIYFELGDYANIVKAMEQMLTEREIYVKRIIEQKKKSKFTLDIALENIDRYLLELVPIRSTWV